MCTDGKWLHYMLPIQSWKYIHVYWNRKYSKPFLWHRCGTRDCDHCSLVLVNEWCLIVIISKLDCVNHSFIFKRHFVEWHCFLVYAGLILGLHPTDERRCYKVTPSVIGWSQTSNQPCLYIISQPRSICSRVNIWRALRLNIRMTNGRSCSSSYIRVVIRKEGCAFEQTEINIVNLINSWTCNMKLTYDNYR